MLISKTFSLIAIYNLEKIYIHGRKLWRSYIEHTMSIYITYTENGFSYFPENGILGKVFPKKRENSRNLECSKFTDFYFPFSGNAVCRKYESRELKIWIPVLLTSHIHTKKNVHIIIQNTNTSTYY